MRKRALLILACGLLMAHVVLLAASMECSCCPCSTPDNDCPHGCEICLCSSMARIVVPAEMGLRALSLVGEVHAPPILPGCFADPQDIFHVPRLSIA